MALNDQSDCIKKLRVLLSVLKNASIKQNTSQILGQRISNTIDFKECKGYLLNVPPNVLENVLGEIGNVNSVIDTYLGFKYNTSRPSASFKYMEQFSLSTFNLVVIGYAGSLLASLGLILNVLGIYFLLSWPRREKLFNMLLSTLMIFDSVFLIFRILRSIQFLWLWNHFTSLSIKYHKLYNTLVNAGQQFSLTSSIIMLIGLSHARVCEIKKHVEYSSIPLPWKIRQDHLIKYCSPIAFLTLILLLPVFLEIEDTIDNTDVTWSTVIPSYLELHPYYSLFYVGVLDLGIFGLVPLTCLVYFTYQLMAEVKKHNHRMNNTLEQLNLSFADRIATKDIKMTKMLISILITFILLH